jgi:hypothetical protein
MIQIALTIKDDIRLSKALIWPAVVCRETVLQLLQYDINKRNAN